MFIHLSPLSYKYNLLACSMKMDMSPLGLFTLPVGVMLGCVRGEPSGPWQEEVFCLLVCVC